MTSEWEGNIEVRPNQDGTIDEVLLYDEKGNPLFHTEQMDDNCFWFRLEGNIKDLVGWFGVTQEPGKLPQLVLTHEWEESEYACPRVPAKTDLRLVDLHRSVWRAFKTLQSRVLLDKATPGILAALKNLEKELWPVPEEEMKNVGEINQDLTDVE